MNNKKIAQKFNQELDHLLNKSQMPNSNNTNSQYADDLTFAQQLANTDFSQESKRRIAIRHSLTQSTRSVQRPMLPRLANAFWQVTGVAFIAVILFFSWTAVSNQANQAASTTLRVWPQAGETLHTQIQIDGGSENESVELEVWLIPDTDKYRLTMKGENEETASFTQSDGEYFYQGPLRGAPFAPGEIFYTKVPLSQHKVSMESYAEWMATANIPDMGSPTVPAAEAAPFYTFIPVPLFHLWTQLARVQDDCGDVACVAEKFHLPPPKNSEGDEAIDSRSDCFDWFFTSEGGGGIGQDGRLPIQRIRINYLCAASESEVGEILPQFRLLTVDTNNFEVLEITDYNKNGVSMHIRPTFQEVLTPNQLPADFYSTVPEEWQWQEGTPSLPPDFFNGNEMWLISAHQSARASLDAPIEFELTIGYNINSADAADISLWLGRPSTSGYGYSGSPDHRRMITQNIALSAKDHEFTFTFTVDDPAQLSDFLDSTIVSPILIMTERGQPGSFSNTFSNMQFALDSTEEYNNKPEGASSLENPYVDDEVWLISAQQLARESLNAPIEVELTVGYNLLSTETGTLGLWLGKPNVAESEPNPKQSITSDHPISAEDHEFTFTFTIDDPAELATFLDSKVASPVIIMMRGRGGVNIMSTTLSDAQFKLESIEYINSTYR